MEAAGVAEGGGAAGGAGSGTGGARPCGRRRVLAAAVAALLAERGVERCEAAALETLLEALLALLTALGDGARAHAELAGRAQPTLGDVVLALVAMGLPVGARGLRDHAFRPSAAPPLQAPPAAAPPKALGILQAGVKQSHPPYVSAHLALPVFPDPHAYIRTPTHKQPVTEYEAIREKAANQKRDVERALTRFVAKTSETHSLFVGEDSNMFPLVACTPQMPVYLKALLPSDQVFDFEEEFPSSPQRLRKCREPEDDGEEGKESEEGARGEADAIDNPYLRPVKVPRKKKKAG